jgi:proteasome lid subunit RPN8/RPN11
MLGHAKAEWPTECCGLLAGKDGVVNKIYKLGNQDGSRVSYLADPHQQLRAFEEMEDLGIELLAIYHSHPDTESYPSQIDMEKAFYPEALYVIISLKDPAGEVKAFRISREGEIVEKRFEIF